MLAVADPMTPDTGLACPFLAVDYHCDKLVCVAVRRCCCWRDGREAEEPALLKRGRASVAEVLQAFVWSEKRVLVPS